MEFTKILKNPNRIDKNQISYLRSIIDDFPYLQSARAIYLKALKDTKSFKFHGELKIVAAYTTERNVLFDYITNQEKIGTELTSEKADKAKESFLKRYERIDFNKYYLENPFHESCKALYHWAPIADELKTLDKKIVLNSMKLKWGLIIDEFRSLTKKL